MFDASKVFCTRTAGAAPPAVGMAVKLAVSRTTVSLVSELLNALSSATAAALELCSTALPAGSEAALTTAPLRNRPPADCEMLMPRRLMKAGVSLMMVTPASPGAIHRPLPATWSPRRSMAPALALMALMVTPSVYLVIAATRPAVVEPSSRPSSSSSVVMRVTSLL